MPDMVRVAVERLVRLYEVDPAAGRRALELVRQYAELTPEERRRVRQLVPAPTLAAAEQVVGEVWSSQLQY